MASLPIRFSDFRRTKSKAQQKKLAQYLAGLDSRESVLKAFEVVKALVPAMCGTVSKYEDDIYDKESVIHADISHFYRYNISPYEFFEFVANSENVNVAVMMLRNKANFAWMNDVNKQKEIVKIFKFLSSEDALSVLYFVHSTNCSERFTADYVADKTRINQERVAEILDEFCSVGACHWITAHITERKIRVYECHGDGILLSLISLALERMCGRQSYEYNFNGGCKMIGDK